ncbi:MAG: trypsin-like peptidase domain-containing protein [Planctomycetes bacterium]|nr:trypsin-like peptidase domain-containing protein [Planctomycetota bacterium]
MSAQAKYTKHARAVAIGLWLVLAAVSQPRLCRAETALEDALRMQRELREAVARANAPFVFVGGGSGVCISADGYVLTNNHVVARHTRWMVRVYGWGKLAMAEVVGRDAQGDVALLKIEEAKGLPFAPLADLKTFQAGRRVLALGDPFKLGDMDGAPSASLGTLCALHRYLGDPKNPGQKSFYADALQTDAAVNPGSSGGPLFALDGALLGLTGQIMARYGGKANSGIAYAVPADQILRFLPLLKAARGGNVCHGDLPAGLKLAFEGPAENPEDCPVAGAGVDACERGSAAWEAGFRSGDRIVTAAGEPVLGAYRLLGIVQSRPQDCVVAFEIARDGKRLELSLRLPRLERPVIPGALGLLGMQLAEDAVAVSDHAHGRRVEAVEAGGPAERAGIRAGDLLAEVDGLDVARPWAEIARALASRHGDAPVAIKGLRPDEHGGYKVLEARVALPAQR